MYGGHVVPFVGASNDNVGSRGVIGDAMSSGFSMTREERRRLSYSR